MWIRAGFLALVLAGSALGAVEAVSAPSGSIACGSGTYENSDGLCIPDPSSGGVPGGASGIMGGGAPRGATAVCQDGDYSYRAASGPQQPTDQPGRCTSGASTPRSRIRRRPL